MVIFGLDRARTTLVIVKCDMKQLTNRNVPVKIFSCGEHINTQDCARLRPFQHALIIMIIKLQQYNMDFEGGNQSLCPVRVTQEKSTNTSAAAICIQTALLFMHL